MAIISNSGNKITRTEGRIIKKRLTEYEYRKWLEIGEIDVRQNWLELFTGYLMDDIGAVIHGGSDNQEKQAEISKLIRPMGFEDVGLGTNVYTASNRHYPGVVFKIALDANGLADNFNDVILMRMVNSFLAERGISAPPGYEKYNRVLDRHNTGIVSVQDRKPVIISQTRMDAFRADILKTLNILAEEFLIMDLAPSEYNLNYGVNRDGTWCFIDASDIYPIGHLKHGIRCTNIVGYNEAKKKAVKCGAPLQYSADFTKIRCRKCGKVYFPPELWPADKGGKNMKKTSDGMTSEERENMRVQQIEAMRANGVKVFTSDVPGKRSVVTANGVVTSGRTLSVTRHKVLRTSQASSSIFRPVRSDPIPAKTAPATEEDTDVDGVESETTAIEHGSEYEPVNIDEVPDNPETFDEPEDDEDAVEYSTVSEPADNSHVVNAIDDSNEDEDGEPGFDEPVESGVVYKIVLADSVEPGEVPGIFIEIYGDTGLALGELLPIYVKNGDGDDCLAVTTDIQRREILKALSDE